MEVSGPPSPSKPVTIRDIADALGIHKSTVSIALSGKGRISSSLRDRIMALADELGYEPDPLAQRLASRSKNKVICLCSGSLDSGRGTEKIAAIQTTLTTLGLEVPFYTPAKPSRGGDAAQISLFRQLRRQRPQAIVCSVHAFHDAAFAELEQYQQEGGIVVSYDLPIPLNCDQVVFDRVDNAYQGARYLLERGHRQLGLAISRLSPSSSSNINTTQNNRVAGFRKALEEWGVEVRPEWIFENANYEQGGSEMARNFLAMPQRPTGLCVVNDYVAMAFMVEVMQAGLKIPQDVSMVGQDNLPISAYCPVPLTSISQPAEEIVQQVVEILISRLEGDTQPPRTVTIRGHLVERQSVMTRPA